MDLASIRHATADRTDCVGARDVSQNATGRQKVNGGDGLRGRDDLCHTTDDTRCVSLISPRIVDAARAALRQWGLRSQQDQLIEELGELLVALSHYRRARTDVGPVREELADVVLMLVQLIEAFGAGDVERALDRKVRRLEQRLALAGPNSRRRRAYVAGSSRELDRCKAAVRAARALDIDVGEHHWTEDLEVIRREHPDDTTVPRMTRMTGAAACVGAMARSSVLWLLAPEATTVGAWVELGMALERARLRRDIEIIISGSPQACAATCFTELVGPANVYHSDDLALRRVHATVTCGWPQ